MNDPQELFDGFAAKEHERWGSWQEYLHSCCARNEDGSLTIPAEKVAHWERLINTPFEELSVHSKNSDREQVMRYWPDMVDYVASWLESNVSSADADAWREEMTIETGVI